MQVGCGGKNWNDKLMLSTSAVRTYLYPEENSWIQMWICSNPESRSDCY